MNNSSTAPVMLFESKQGRRSTKSPQLPQALGVTSCDFVDGLAAGSLTTSAKYEPSKGRQSRCSAARFGVSRKNEFLCANSVTLCVSVVKLPGKTFTTEARCTYPGFVDTKISPNDTVRKGGVHGRKATRV